MSEESKRRSRKSKLVPRDYVEFEEDKNYTKIDAAPPISMNGDESASIEPNDYDNTNQTASTSSPIEFSIRIEVEECNEEIVDIESEALAKDDYHPGIIINESEIRKQIEALQKVTTSYADKYLEMEIRNYWGRCVRDLEQSALETLLQEAVNNWRIWHCMSKNRGAVLSYKCYVCSIGWWNLSMFREHIKQHVNIKIETETYSDECNIVAFVGKFAWKNIHIDGVCPQCLRESQHHVINTHESSMCYTCDCCNDKHFTCVKLLEHHGVCQRYHKKHFKDAIRCESDWKCNICSINFVTKSKYDAHLVVSHLVRSDDPIVSPFTKSCSKCLTKYVLVHLHTCPLKGFNVQCQYCCRKFQNKLFTSIHEQFGKTNTICKVCYKYLGRQCTLMEHIVTHSKNYMLAYKCLRCPNMLYPNEASIKRHNSRCHENKFDRRRCHIDRVLLPKACMFAGADNKPSYTAVKCTEPKKKTVVMDETQKAVNAIGGYVQEFHNYCDSMIHEDTSQDIDVDQISEIESESRSPEDYCIAQMSKQRDELDEITIVNDVSQDKVDLVSQGDDVSQDKVDLVSQGDDVSQDEVEIVSQGDDVSQDEVDLVSQGDDVSQDKLDQLSQDDDASQDKLYMVLPDDLSQDKLDQVSQGDNESQYKLDDSSQGSELSQDRLDREFRAITEGNFSNITVTVKKEVLDIKEEAIDYEDMIAATNIDGEIKKETEEFENALSKVFRASKNLTTIKTEFALEEEELIIKDEPIVKCEPIYEEEEIYEDDIIILNPHNYLLNNDTTSQDVSSEVCSSEMDTASEITIGEVKSEKPDKPTKRRMSNDTRKVVRIQKKYHCRRCDFIGVHKVYKRHIETSCPIKKGLTERKTKRPLLTYKCTACDEIYLGMRKFVEHYENHGLPCNTCPHCMVAFNHSSNLIVHIENVIKQSFLKLQLIKASECITSRSNRVYQCKKCFGTVKASDFFQHWESHLELDVKDAMTPARVITNDEDSEDVVAESCLSPENLKVAMEHLQKSIFDDSSLTLKQCSVCSRLFDRRNDCKRHMVEHLLRDAYATRSSSGTLKCQICGAEFEQMGISAGGCRKISSTDQYKQHMRDHGSLPIYKCDLCKKSFSDSSNFAKHKKVHNLRVHVCDTCHKKFHSKVTLAAHLEMHRVTKPFECKPCGKLFYSLTSYNRHLRSRHDKLTSKFRCQYCGLKFMRLREKWDHLWEVHKERKAKADCPYCSRSFRKLQDVKNHLKREHNVKVVGGAVDSSVTTHMMID